MDVDLRIVLDPKGGFGMAMITLFFIFSLLCAFIMDVITSLFALSFHLRPVTFISKTIKESCRPVFEPQVLLILVSCLSVVDVIRR